MVRVRKKESLNETVSKMVLEAPMIAKKAQPGQFVICLLYTSRCV